MSNSDCMKIIENLKESISKNDSKIILESLEFLNTFEMTKNILQSSKVGLTINKLRDNKNKGISEISTKILEKWRKQFPANKNKLNNSNNNIQIQNNSSNDPNKSPNGKNDKEPKKLSIESPVLKKITLPNKTNNPIPTKTPPVKKLVSKKPPEIPKVTGDVKRDRVIHQLKNALDLYPQEKPTTDLEPKNTLLKAQEIEEAIMNKMGGLVDTYFQKFRLLLSNLESIDNDCLREKVLVEEILVDKLLEMEEIDLVSPKEKEERIKNYEMSLKASESTTSANHIITDMYKCNNCGQRKISYTQLQIRSADEPMTLFLTCLTCGKKWRK